MDAQSITKINSFFNQLNKGHKRLKKIVEQNLAQEFKTFVISHQKSLRGSCSLFYQWCMLISLIDKYSKFNEHDYKNLNEMYFAMAYYYVKYYEKDKIRRVFQSIRVTHKCKNLRYDELFKDVDFRIRDSNQSKTLKKYLSLMKEMRKIEKLS